MPRTDGLRTLDVFAVYIVEDGFTDVPKAERTGCWAADFPKVLAYKTAYYQQIAMNDWTRNVDGAVDAGVSREDAEEMMGPRPPTPAVFVDTAWKASGTKPRAEAPQPGDERSLDDKILEAFDDETYTGSRRPNRKKRGGMPKFRPFREHTKLWDMSKAQLIRCWDVYEETE